MEIIAAYGPQLLGLTCIAAFFMAWGIGANDVADAMGTSVGAGALSIRQAILIAVVFEFLGAFFAGGAVTETIRGGIIDPALLADSPHTLVLGMMSALFAAGTWLLVASVRGWPVSTTHSIVGAIVGFAAVGLSLESVNWSQVGAIALAGLLSPLLAGTVAFALILSLQKLILDTEEPFCRAKRLIPVYIGIVGFMIAMLTLVRGLKHAIPAVDPGLDASPAQALPLSLLVGALAAVIGIYLLRRIGPDGAGATRDAGLDRVFGVLMIFTACAMAFAHGSNDVANAVGPLAAVASIVKSGAAAVATAALPGWILLTGALGIVVGVSSYGWKVIATVGCKITELTPARGFAATLAAASTVVLASAAGLPVSTTYTLVGAVLGVGLARGIAALDLRVIGSILISWLITMPAGAILAVIFFLTLRGIYG